MIFIKAVVFCVFLYLFFKQYLFKFILNFQDSLNIFVGCVFLTKVFNTFWKVFRTFEKDQNLLSLIKKKVWKLIKKGLKPFENLTKGFRTFKRFEISRSFFTSMHESAIFLNYVVISGIKFRYESCMLEILPIRALRWKMSGKFRTFS